MNVEGYSDVKPTSEVIIDSTKVASAKMTLVEEKLYGTASTEPTLPEPGALLALIGSSTTSSN